MKKLSIMLLAGIVAASLLPGSAIAEEQAMNEIAAHMISEAAQDGVDLENMLKAEYEAYEAGREARQSEIDAHNDFAALMQEAVKKPVQAFGAYMSAVTPEDILLNAKAYNDAYDEYLSLAGGDPVKESSLLNLLERMNPIYKRTKVAESVYHIKAAYAGFAGKDKYSEARFYYNTEEDTANIVFQGIDETTYIVNELLVLKGDGSTCQIDFASFMTERTSLVQSLGFEGGKYYIFTVDNADFKYWEFDVSGQTAKAVPTTVSETSSNEHWFMNTLEELNMGEPY